MPSRLLVGLCGFAVIIIDVFLVVRIGVRPAASLNWWNAVTLLVTALAALLAIWGALKGRLLLEGIASALLFLGGSSAAPSTVVFLYAPPFILMTVAVTLEAAKRWHRGR